MSNDDSKGSQHEINPRLLRMMKATEKMENAMEGIKDHIDIKPFEYTHRGKGPFDLSDDDRHVSSECDYLSEQLRSRRNESLAHTLFYGFVVPTIKTLDDNETGLSEEDKRRIIQSRINVLIIIQTEAVDAESDLLDEVNLAAFEVLKA
jgi:hypothetical protein|nr:MAG TPA: hypothetical protein [Bacteriophage sp.]